MYQVPCCCGQVCSCLHPIIRKKVVIKIIETSDVHGNFFPYNLLNGNEWSGSLARVQFLCENEQRDEIWGIIAC